MKQAHDQIHWILYQGERKNEEQEGIENSIANNFDFILYVCDTKRVLGKCGESTSICPWRISACNICSFPPMLCFPWIIHYYVPFSRRKNEDVQEEQMNKHENESAEKESVEKKAEETIK